MKRILLAVSGMSPQIITEALYCLHCDERAGDGRVAGGWLSARQPAGHYLNDVCPVGEKNKVPGNLAGGSPRRAVARGESPWAGGGAGAPFAPSFIPPTDYLAASAHISS